MEVDCDDELIGPCADRSEAFSVTRWLDYDFNILPFTAVANGTKSLKSGQFFSITK